MIYDSGRFLEYAKRNKVKVSPKTIREVEKVKQEDIETTQRNRRAHYGDIFSGIDFGAIRELSDRLGQIRIPKESIDGARRAIENLTNINELNDFRVRIDNFAKVLPVNKMTDNFEEQNEEINKDIPPVAF